MLHQAGRTRTSDSLDPNQVLYQTELRPVELGSALNVSLVSHDQGAMRRSSLSGATTTSVNTRRVERLVSLSEHQGGGTRTHDLTSPRRVLLPTELHPVVRLVS